MEEKKKELEGKKLEDNLVDGAVGGIDIMTREKHIQENEQHFWNTDTKGNNGSTLGGGTGNGSIFG